MNESSVSSRTQEWLSAHAVLVVLFVGLLARLPTIMSRPLWYDEAFAVLFSAEGPRAMSYGTLVVDQGIAADVHPLGYYTLLWAWQAVAGGSPLAVRALSVVLGLVLVYLGYRLARKLFNERIATLAALALALSPFQVHYSQEVRMYALLAVLLLSATLVYWKALEEGSLRYWLAFAVLGAAAQYTHTLAGLFLIPLGLTPLWRRQWSNLGKTVLAGLLAILLYLPWLIYLPSQLSRVRWAYWIPRPGVAELVRTWLVFAAGLPVSANIACVHLVRHGPGHHTRGLGNLPRLAHEGHESPRWGLVVVSGDCAGFVDVRALNLAAGLSGACAADLWGRIPAMVDLGS